jgi:hypothetical protein
MNNEEISYTIEPSELDYRSLFEFLTNNCKYNDVVNLYLMLHHAIMFVKECEKGSDE